MAAAMAVLGVAAATPVPASVTITEFATPHPDSQPAGITQGPDGNFWVTQKTADSILRITPSGTITEFPVMAGDGPSHITTGPHGWMWFVADAGDRVGKIRTNGTGLVEYPLLPKSEPHAITLGPDNNLWVGLIGTGMLARVKPNGQIDYVVLPSPAHSPHWLTTGPDGMLWFTEREAGGIGRIDPNAGGGDIGEVRRTLTQFVIPSPASLPHGISRGSDNKLWFGEHNTNQIGVIDPLAGSTWDIQRSIREYPVPNDGIGTNRTVNNTAPAPDGRMWFTEQDGSRVVSFFPSTPSAMCEYVTPTDGSGPASIVAATDGNIWFTEIYASQVARLVPSAPTSTGCP